jgi:hypothetical protein
MLHHLSTNAALSTGNGFTAERHRVLGNTYGLLALPMVPTVLGACIGVASGIARRCPAEQHHAHE